MNTTDLHEMLAEAEAQMLDPHELYNPALVGAGWRFNDGPLAVYDLDRVLAILAQDWGEDEAKDWYEFNMVGSWVGPGTPIFIQLLTPQGVQIPLALEETRPDPV
tara:strand:- start:107 stop:421 length:315 start_codon:yes stop_codon:yes gene_type:complete